MNGVLVFRLLVEQKRQYEDTLGSCDEHFSQF